MHPMKSPAEDKDKENKKQLRNLQTRKRSDIDEGQGRERHTKFASQIQINKI